MRHVYRSLVPKGLNGRSKKRSKQRFFHILKKYQTDFKNNGVKMVVITLAPTQATLYVGATTPKGVQEQKYVRNCDFCVTEGPRYMEFPWQLFIRQK